MAKRKPKVVPPQPPPPPPPAPTYEESFFKMLEASKLYFGNKLITEGSPEADLVIAYAKYLDHLNEKTLQTTGEPL